MTTVFQGRHRCAHFVMIAMYFTFVDNAQSIQKTTVESPAIADSLRSR